MNAETGGAAATHAKSQSIVIQGVEFTAPAPYGEGHVLTSNEAIVLNQVLGENLRNNFSPKVKKLKDEIAKEKGVKADEVELSKKHLHDLASEFAAYATGYEFKGLRVRSAPVDPVAREARKLASEAVRKSLKERNIDIKTLAEGKFDELVDKLLEKNPFYKTEAERRIAATKKAAGDALEGIL